MRLRLRTFAALLALAACAPAPVQKPPPAPDLCAPTAKLSPVGSISSGMPVNPALVGVPVTVGALGVFTGCDGGEQGGVTVAVEIDDPLNHAVDASIRLRPSEAEDQSVLDGLFGTGFDGGGLVAEATFTPARAGPYHLDFRFSPGLGRVQQDLLAALDRRDGGFVGLPMPDVCDRFDLELGVGLCLVSGRLLSVLDGGTTDSLEAYTFCADGADVWTLDLGATGPLLGLSRLLPDGSFLPVAVRSLVGEPTGIGDAGLLQSRLVSAGQQVLIVSAPHLQEARWVDGGIEIGPDLPVPLGPPVFVQWSPGVGAVVGGLTGPGGARVTDALCVDDFADASVQCFPFTPFGSDGRAVWAQDSTFQWSAWRVTDRPQPEVLPAAFGEQTSFDTFSSGDAVNGPFFFSAEPVGLVMPDLDPEPVLAAYGQPPPEAQNVVVDRGGATGRIYWQGSSAAPGVFYLQR